MKNVLMLAVFALCAGGGLKGAAGLYARCGELASLAGGLRRLEQNIRFCERRLSDALKNTGCGVFEEMSELTAAGAEPFVAWEQASASMELEAETRAELEEFFRGLGRKDKTSQLEDLKNAYKKVSDEIKSYSYTPTSSSKSSGSGGGSSSGSRSSGSSSKSTPRFVASGTGYAEAYRGKITSVSYNGETYIKGHNSNYWYKQSDAQRIDGGRTYYWKTGTT